MGATGVITTGTLIPALAKLKLSLGALGTIATGPIGLLILAIGGLYLAWEKNLFGMRDITIEAFNNIKGNFSKLKDSITGGGSSAGAFGDEVEEAGDKAKGAVTGVDTLATSMDGLETNTDEAKTALNEFGQVIETFDEWVARLAEETETANKEMADAAEDAYKRYADAMGPIEDRLYELSHTEEEVAARNLLIKRKALEEATINAGLALDVEKKAMGDIAIWYSQEIDLIKAKLVEQQNAQIETARKTEESANIQKAAIKGITDEYTGLINKIDAVGKAAEAAAKKATSEAFLAGVPTIVETGYVPSYIPKLQLGTPYVPKTGLYQLHQGEAVISKNQNTTNNSNSFSPSIVVNVSGGGNAQNIAYEVKKVLDESIRQFRRSGFELVPGRG